MNICLVSTENPYDKQNNGGIGTYTGEMAEGLARYNNKVHIITLNNSNETNPVPLNIRENVTVHFVSKGTLKYTHFLEQAYHFYNKVIEIMNDYKLDYIEVPEWLAQGYFLANEKLAPIVTRLHTPLYLIEQMMDGRQIYKCQQEIKLLERQQAKLSSITTSPSIDLANMISKEWGIASSVLANPINVDRLGEISLNDEAKLYGEDEYILFLGRLEMRKGVLLLSDIVEPLVKQFPHIKVVFCGKDSIYQRLRTFRSIIKEKNRNFLSNIRFIEHASNDQKIELIKQAKIVVLPSIWENFSYVALESMALGATVVASDVGGFNEMIKPGENGYLFTSGDKESLLEKLTKIFTGESRIDRNRVIESIKSRYDSAIIIPEYLKLIESRL